MDLGDQASGSNDSGRTIEGRHVTLVHVFTRTSIKKFGCKGGWFFKRGRHCSRFAKV